MEPAVRAYLLRIINTLSFGLIWLIINSTAGIMYGWAFPAKKISAGNIIFYVWLVLSFVSLLMYIIKLWNKPLDFEDKH